MPANDEDGGGFLARWSRRKALERQGRPLDEPPAGAPVHPAAQPAGGVAPSDRSGRAPAAPTGDPAAPATPALAPGARAAAPTPAPLHAGALAVEHAAAPAAVPAPPAPPTLDEVAALGRDSDYRRFVARDVDPAVKNAALKKLFSDPHFNVMDGMDVYIDDYGRPDPLPAGMMRQMVQSQALGLFRDEAAVAAAAAVPPAPAGVDRAPATDGARPEADPGNPADPADPTGHSPAAPARPDPANLTDARADDHADLRLQPLDAAGPPGPGAGPGEHAGGQRPGPGDAVQPAVPA